MSKFVTKLFALLLICMMIPAAYADASMPPADQISPDLTHASYSWRNTARMTDEYTITYVESGISPVSGGLFISATTEASMVVDTIGGVISIERWENGGWRTYYQAYFEDYGTYQCEVNCTINAQSGYYYRLVVSHTAENSIDLVMCTSTTKAVYLP